MSACVRGRPLAVLLGCLLMASLLGCQSSAIFPIQAFPEGGTLSDRITIVSWNAQKGSSVHFRSELSRLISEHRPDLLFLQEATDDLLLTDRVGGYFAGSWSYPWPNGETIGLLALSKSPPHSLWPLPSKQREFLLTAPKLSLVTEYPLPNGQHLMVLNIHLLAFERWGTRGIESQLEDFRLAIADHEGPVILLGDFNTWSEPRLELVRELARDQRLTEVTGFPEGRRTGGTSSSWLNKLYGVDKGLPLDRIYYRGLDAYDAQVLPFDVSDHRPLLVTMTLRPEARL